MKRVLLVVDVSNLYYCINRKFNKRLNFSKLLEAVVKDGEQLHRAIAYGASLGDKANSFKSMLQHHGFQVKYKEPRIHPAGLKQSRKADWDVGISIDVVKILSSVDVVVFGTADGDLAPCIEYVINCGKEARVIGSGISRELKDVAHQWSEITDDLLESKPEVTV